MDIAYTGNLLSIGASPMLTPVINSATKQVMMPDSHTTFYESWKGMMMKTHFYDPERLLRV